MRGEGVDPGAWPLLLLLNVAPLAAPCEWSALCRRWGCAARPNVVIMAS